MKKETKTHPLRSHLSDYDAFPLDVAGIKLMHATEAFNQRVGRLIGGPLRKKKKTKKTCKEKKKKELIPLRSLDTDSAARRRHPAGVGMPIIPGARSVVNVS